MASKEDLKLWLVAALKELGGRGRIVPICRVVWRDHEIELADSGNLFFTWQYDIRWAATVLRAEGLLKPAHGSPQGVWELT